MNEKKSVLFITDTFGYGGAEKQLAFVAEGLVNRGFSVAICNLNSIRQDEGQREVDSRIRIYVAEIIYQNALKSNYDYISFSLKIIREFHPDIIVGFKQLANFCTAVAGRLSHTPSIISERADPYWAYKNAGWQLKFKLWFINHADGGVFQTEQAAAFYKRLMKKSVVIPNPIFIKGEVPQVDYSALPKTIVSLGRLDNKQKRIDVMLDAFAMFHKTHTDYLLKIYGNGSDEEMVRQWIEEKELSGCVKMMGVSSQPLLDMNKEGIFLLTSDFEGISNALLEAMACGLPVISTDHTPGGARLLIKDGENGLLVPMGDAEAISQALCHYADDPTLAERCGKNAKKVLETYAPEKMLDKWEQYIVRVSE